MMNYQSPIEVFQTQMQSQIVGEIYKAVMKVGVNVDKEELLKALQYDRDQYQKGYTDRDSEIVRCKDCKFYQKPEYGFTKGDCTYGSVWYQTEEDGFCSKAKVKG